MLMLMKIVFISTVESNLQIIRAIADNCITTRDTRDITKQYFE